MRLFIALPLPARVEEALAKVIFVFKQKEARVKWVAPKNIHLTVKFLGETDEKLVPAISVAIEKVSRNYDVAKSFIDKVGAFPNLNRPRVIWAGFSESIESLAGIASDIDRMVNELGFEKENRAFKTHLTLGRVKDNRQLGDLPSVIQGYEMVPEEVIFDRIVLFKSTLTSKGPVYDRLYEAKLKKAETFG